MLYPLKKKTIESLLILSSLIYLTCGANVCLSAKKEDMVNERFPVNPKHMEELWGLDCDATLKNIQQHKLVRQSNKDSSVTNKNAEPLRRLELCSFIYNMPDSQTYRPCPDFKAWQQWLLKKGPKPQPCQR